MGPSIDFNSYNNGAMNDNILNQLMQSKANRWSPAVQQANQGLSQGVSDFNNNNIFNRLMGSIAGQGGSATAPGGNGGQGGGMMGQMMPGMGGGGSGGSGGSVAGTAASAGWAYLGMM